MVALLNAVEVSLANALAAAAVSPTYEDNRFVARELVLGEATEAAEGLNALLGISSNSMLGSLLKMGVDVIELEFAEHGGEEDRANLAYVLHGVAQDESDPHFPAHVLADYKRGYYHGGNLEPGDYDFEHKVSRAAPPGLTR